MPNTYTAAPLYLSSYSRLINYRGELVIAPDRIVESHELSLGR